MDHYTDDRDPVQPGVQDDPHRALRRRGEAARYLGRHGESRPATVILVSAVTPSVLQTDASRGVRAVFELQPPGRTARCSPGHPPGRYHITEREDPAAITARFRRARARDGQLPGRLRASACQAARRRAPCGTRQNGQRRSSPTTPQVPSRQTGAEGTLNETLAARAVTAGRRRNPGLVRRLGTARARPGTPAGMAPRRRRPSQAGLHLPRVRRRCRPETAAPGQFLKPGGARPASNTCWLDDKYVIASYP